MPNISRFHLTNHGAYDAWIGVIYVDPNDREKKQHGPIWDPQGHRISWGSSGTMDIGNCSIPSGAHCWIAIYVYSGWDCYGLSTDGGGLVYQAGDPHMANYRSDYTTLSATVTYVDSTPKQ
jgi:hypothetical protein